MELLTLRKIELKETVRKANAPFEFELVMHCKEDLDEKVLFTILYTVDVSNESEDQILSETEIYPVPKGNIKFLLEADAPCIKEIPHNQLFGLTSIIIIGKYKGEQFIRIGYIVDVYYPGIPNEKLLYNEDEEEDIVDEEFEEEDDQDENFDDLIVEDEQNEELEGEIEEELEGEEENESEEKEENESEDLDSGETKKEISKPFTEAVVEKLAETKEEQEDEIKPSEFNEINEELEKRISDDQNPEDLFEFRGFKLNYNYIEINVMVPPTTHSYLIKWKDDSEDVLLPDIEEDSAKKIKKEE